MNKIRFLFLSNGRCPGFLLVLFIISCGLWSCKKETGPLPNVDLFWNSVESDPLYIQLTNMQAPSKELLDSLRLRSNGSDSLYRSAIRKVLNQQMVEVTETFALLQLKYPQLTKELFLKHRKSKRIKAAAYARPPVFRSYDHDIDPILVTGDCRSRYMEFQYAFHTIELIYEMVMTYCGHENAFLYVLNERIDNGMSPYSPQFNAALLTIGKGQHNYFNSGGCDLWRALLVERGYNHYDFHRYVAQPIEALGYDWEEDLILIFGLCELSNVGGDSSGTGDTGTGGNTADGSGGSGSSSASSFNNRIDDSGLPSCIRNILDILNAQQGNSIGDILNKLDGNVPGYNWKITGDPTMKPTEYGSVQYPYNSSQQTVVGYINTSPTVMSEISELKMAATLAHEAVHAYLVNELNSAPGSVEKTYPELFKALMKRRSTSSAQHVIMINNYVDDIAASVKFYASTMGYSSAIDEQVYKDIAWSGLVDMAEFDTAVPNVTDRERIRNRLKAESSGQPFGSLYPVGDKLSLRCK